MRGDKLTLLYLSRTVTGAWGFWTPAEDELHITFRELRAVRLFVEHYLGAHPPPHLLPQLAQLLFGWVLDASSSRLLVFLMASVSSYCGVTAASTRKLCHVTGCAGNFETGAEVPQFSVFLPSLPEGQFCILYSLSGGTSGV